MPALMEAYKISSRAAGTGFDWPNIEDIFEKLNEEIRELRAEIAKMPAPPTPHSRGIAGSTEQRIPEELRLRLEDEVGDMFFVLVNISRYLSIDPEMALRSTNRKFRSRFQKMELAAEKSNRPLDKMSIDEMEELWQQAKRSEMPAKGTA